MKSMDLLEVVGSIRDKYIMEAGKCREQTVSVLLQEIDRNINLNLTTRNALFL